MSDGAVESAAPAPRLPADELPLAVSIVTLFPELFAPYMATSFIRKAIESDRLRMHLEPLREHGLGRHKSVDDTPYGGGSGMVMRVDCLVAALRRGETMAHQGRRSHRVLVTPQGRRFDQRVAQELADRSAITLICGRYEGFDERIREYVDEELSLGDFVMTGGEIAAMAFLEAAVRLLPGVLGNADSLREESFADASRLRLEYPQYTRPASFEQREVPGVLLTGDHGRIAAWRERTSLERTRARRADLLAEGSEESQ